MKNRVRQPYPKGTSFGASAIDYRLSPPPSESDARIGAFYIHIKGDPRSFVFVRARTFFFAAQRASVALNTSSQGLEGKFFDKSYLEQHNIQNVLESFRWTHQR